MPRFLFRLSFLILCLMPAPAWAAAGAWQQADEASVRLLSASDATNGQKEILFGLEIQLADGWHSYWRSPGDAGLPPSFDWKESQNLAQATLLYPAPHRFEAMGMEAIGYKGRVLLPLHVALKDPQAPLTLAGRLDLLVCSDLCVPKHFDLSLALPARRGLSESAEAPLIAQAMAQVPQFHSEALTFEKATRSDKAVQVTVRGAERLRDPDLFVENDKNVIFASPQKTVSVDGRTAFFTLPIVGSVPQGVDLAKLPLTFTVVDGGASLEIAQDPSVSIAPKAASFAVGPKLFLPYWSLLLLALAGGFVLNLMPCVLPVLSLKVMGLVRHSGGERRAIRASFLSTAAGIVFSFLLLAMATVGLKATGHAFGWGVQFQHPVFLLFMIALLTFFAANLWGFFTLLPPRFALDVIDPVAHPRLAGDFATGAFATLLATPCSAPFLGTAVAFALASGPRTILAVFFALGVGMSLPYLAVALWPSLASVLPKPGKWMVRLSRLLGLGLAGTAVWLLFILREQMGATATALVALGMAAIAGQLYLRHRNVLRSLTWPLIACVLAGSFAFAFLASAPATQPSSAGAWAAFDERTLERHVREGKTVFVDVTAEWCLTCKANKRFTLSRADIKERLFHQPNVVALQADWTNPNPAVAAFLKKHGRYGIPFDMIIGPQAPQGIVLPELLTPSAVLDALAKAQGRAAPACPAGLPEGVGC